MRLAPPIPSPSPANCAGEGSQPGARRLGARARLRVQSAKADFGPSLPRLQSPQARPGEAPQKSALPGVRGYGSTSRMLAIPVAYMIIRSKPRPNPACGTVP